MSKVDLIEEGNIHRLADEAMRVLGEESQVVMDAIVEAAERLPTLSLDARVGIILIYLEACAEDENFSNKQ